MKVKKSIVILIIFILVISLIIGKNISNKKQISKNGFEILTSFYPIYIMTLNITNGAEDVKVSNMAEKYTGCIHDYTLTTNDMRKFENCDVFIQNGAGLEKFSDKIIESYPEVKIINAADKVTNFIEDEDEVNSHIWLSITNYIDEVKDITQELSKIDYKNAMIYQRNCENYVSKLIDLKSKFDNLKIDNEKAINLNESLEYLLKENNFESTLIETDHEQASISALKVKEIIKLMNDENIKNIFIDKNDSTKLAKVIESETNAKIHVLNSAMSGPNDLDSYINIMNENYNVLKEQE